MTEFTNDGPFAGEDGPGLVRRQSWPVDGPVELELTVDVGRIRVHLDEQIGDSTGDSTVDGTDDGTGAHEVRVEVRHDPSAGGGWSQGITGLISWLGNATGSGGGAGTSEDLAAAAVSAAEISWSESGRRLVVRSSQELPLRVVPLAITVSAPARSRLAARTGAGDVRVTGRPAWAGVRTGTGLVSLAAVDGDVDVTTGAGDVEIGPVSGRARLRTGSGSVSVGATGGSTEIKTGSGDISLGAVAADLGVRTGSGDVAIADARSGHLQMTTGSGGLRVGVHPGVRAELDLSAGSGRARSELEVSSVAPELPAALHVHGRTGSGDVLVTRAAVPV
jgi:hypothetical protein